MECIAKVTDDIVWVGGNDRRLNLFENIFPIPKGISYNSYVLLDDKTVLLDTVDKAISEPFFENLSAALGGRALDYIVVNHMEPDHAATLAQTCARYPGARVLMSAKAAQMAAQFFGGSLEGRIEAVKEGDELCAGRHRLRFYMAPMVHWPEVMVTYDETDRVLFSADAFGTFGAVSGFLFADEVDFERDWLDEARRYYTARPSRPCSKRPPRWISPCCARCTGRCGAGIFRGLWKNINAGAPISRRRTGCWLPMPPSTATPRARRRRLPWRCARRV